MQSRKNAAIHIVVPNDPDTEEQVMGNMDIFGLNVTIMYKKKLIKGVFMKKYSWMSVLVLQNLALLGILFSHG